MSGADAAKRIVAKLYAAMRLPPETMPATKAERLEAVGAFSAEVLRLAEHAVREQLGPKAELGAASVRGALDKIEQIDEKEHRAQKRQRVAEEKEAEQKAAAERLRRTLPLVHSNLADSLLVVEDFPETIPLQLGDRFRHHFRHSYAWYRVIGFAPKRPKLCVAAIAESDLLKNAVDAVLPSMCYYFCPDTVVADMGGSMDEEHRLNVEFYGGAYRADWGSEWVCPGQPGLGTLVLSTARPGRGRAPPAKTLGFFQKNRRSTEYRVWWMSEAYVERSLRRAEDRAGRCPSLIVPANSRDTHDVQYAWR